MPVEVGVGLGGDSKIITEFLSLTHTHTHTHALSHSHSLTHACMAPLFQIVITAVAIGLVVAVEMELDAVIKVCNFLEIAFIVSSRRRHCYMGNCSVISSSTHTHTQCDGTTSLSRCISLSLFLDSWVPAMPALWPIDDLRCVYNH
jgi:hypothetical protein